MTRVRTAASPSTLMTDWWSTLGLVRQIFYALAIVSSIILVVQLVLSGIGADGFDDVDVNDPHGTGLGVLSVRSVAAFFAGFGWVGVMCINAGQSTFVAIVAGTAAGGLLMGLTILLMRSLMKLHSSGTLNYANAVNEVGTIYVPVPPQRGSGGQVEVVIQGRTVFAEALSDAVEPLRTGAKVRIISLVGQTTFLVEPA